MIRSHRWTALVLGFALALCGARSGETSAQQRAAIPAGPGSDDVDQPLKTSTKNPDAVALVIGVGDYQDSSIPKVEFATRDAEAVRRTLIETMGYTDGRVISSMNAQASIGRLKTAVRQGLGGQVRAGRSDVFVYYSGHGAPNPATKEGYLIPWDFDANYPPTSESAYALKDLYADLGKLGARSVTVVLEACFSGATDSGKNLIKDASPLSIQVENPALSLANGVVISAGGSNEIASWYREHNHGLMTYYWLRAMHGDAEDAQGNVTTDGIKKYLNENVPAKARELKSRTQTPEVLSAAGSRTLAVLPVSALVNGGANLVKTYGSLRVSIDVGGDLYVDGVRQGAIQAGVAFVQAQIATGPHALEVRNDGYVSQRADIVVAEGRQSTQSFAMAKVLPNAPQIIRQFGLIAVTVDRGGALYIDDKKMEDLRPFAIYNSGQIEAGPHRLRVELPGFVTENQEVMVKPNDTASVNIALRAAAVSNSTPNPAPGPVTPPPVTPPITPPPAPVNSVAMEFVRIPAGSFMMGCSAGETRCFDTEKPPHRVTLTKAYDLGKYEVTQAQYQSVMGTNPSTYKTGGNYPVEGVTWNDTQEFLNRMNAKQDGYRYRLPTEAEWEYAARAGTTGSYPGTLDAIAWYGNNAGRSVLDASGILRDDNANYPKRLADNGNQSHPVGQKQANAWGLYDIIGNVEEWVQDWYDEKYYQPGDQTNPRGPASGTQRVERGGSWNATGFGASRVSNRSSALPTARYSNLGFRIVREANATADDRNSTAAPAAGTSIEFVRIPAGNFMMGCATADTLCFDDEKPAHRVTLTKAFELGKFEVTKAQYASVMGQAPVTDTRPMAGITWDEAQEFMNRLNAKRDGYHYRLPTEAEWEYAARAGSTDAYPGTLDAIAWYGNNAGRSVIDVAEIQRTDNTNYGKRLDDNGNVTHPAGQKQANAWGLYDMIGNIREWVQDWYDEKYYTTSPQSDPAGPASGTKRILRGGSYFSDARSARASYRQDQDPKANFANNGFRVARELIATAAAPASASTNSAGMQFVPIPSGSFAMGCSASDAQCDDDEKPSHRVTLTKAFDMGKYEVTQGQYQSVMGANPSVFKGDSLPVENVSWNDAQEFLKRLNARADGYRYRLPTDAEWEYAARAGSAEKYPGALDAIAWYGNNAGRTVLDAGTIWRTDQANYGKRLMDNDGRTHPGGQKQPNAWGLYDIIGNVGEWVQDWYDQKYYAASPSADPKGPGSGTEHVVRGGTWFNDASDARVSYRFSRSPDYQNFTVGFRVVREAIR